MRTRAEVRLALDSAAEADRLARALAPENERFLEAAPEGDTLVLRAEAETPLSVLRTLDDALACLAAARRAAAQSDD